MSIRHALAATAAFVCAGAAVATAADLGHGSYKDVSYAPAIVTQPSWYVRGDAAYARHDTPHITEDDIYVLTEPKYGNSWSAGAGVGVYLRGGFRADVTYDHRFEADVEGTNVHATLGGVRKFGIKSDLLLANLYYDFDAGRFTPYIGAGLGFVRHTTTAGTVETCGCTVGTIDGNETWSVAAAFMAGVDVKLRDRLHLDAGYRFLYLGEAETGAIVKDGTTVSDDPTVAEMHAHELRVGLRYDIR